MIIVAAIALAIVAIGFIAYPLISSREAVEPAEDERSGELHSKRETTYSAIEELKFDYDQGKLSLPDYQDLDKRYKERAISILKEIDARGRGEGMEDEIEEEVMRIRRVHRAAGELVCPQCGGETRRQARLCPRCGSPLPLRCPQCRAAYEVEDRFCPWCGGSISQEGEHD